MNFDSILNGVVGTLGSWLQVFIAYHISYTFVEQMRSEPRHWRIAFWNSKLGMFVAYPFFLFWVAVVSLCLWAGYGTHKEDEDPLRGGGGEVVVDFVPTDKERNEYGVTTFFVLGIPAAVAVYRHYKKNPVKKVEE